MPRAAMSGRLGLYDIAGRLVRELAVGTGSTADPPLDAGTLRATESVLPLMGGTGKPLPAGVYFVRLRAGHTSSTRKLVLVE